MENNRGVNEAKSELTINGPKDSFNEDIKINYNLIKKNQKKFKKYRYEDRKII